MKHETIQLQFLPLWPKVVGYTNIEYISGRGKKSYTRPSLCSTKYVTSREVTNCILCITEVCRHAIKYKKSRKKF